MQNKSIVSIDRRGFLFRTGAILGVLGAAGCDSGETVGKPLGPPMEGGGGNRNRLEKIKEKAAEVPAKKK